MAQPDGAIRILIVDDSVVMRSLLRAVVMTDARLEVTATASNGEAGLRAMETMYPDLVLLDVEMPVMDGLSTLRVMRERGLRVPVIMCSTLTHRGAQVTIEALASGAADYVAKPSGQPSREAAVEALARDLVPKILALTMRRSTPSSAPRAMTSVWPPMVAPSLATEVYGPGAAGWNGTGVAGASPRVVVIGVSTGGPAALDLLLPALPKDFPLPVLVVQHMPELFTKLLAERLDSRCALHVIEAAEGMTVEAGHVYVAKGNWHLEVHGDGRQGRTRLRLTQAQQENHCRPSVDVLFRTAVAAYGDAVLGVILTGMGADGMEGCRLIRAHGGSVLAQDHATSAVWGMPGAVAQAGLAQKVLPLQAIAGEVIHLAHRHGGDVTGIEPMRQKWAV